MFRNPPDTPFRGTQWTPTALIDLSLFRGSWHILGTLEGSEAKFRSYRQIFKITHRKFSHKFTNLAKKRIFCFFLFIKKLPSRYMCGITTIIFTGSRLHSQQQVLVRTVERGHLCLNISSFEESLGSNGKNVNNRLENSHVLYINNIQSTLVKLHKLIYYIIRVNMDL